jgi:hypothetical protein
LRKGILEAGRAMINNSAHRRRKRILPDAPVIPAGQHFKITEQLQLQQLRA